MGTVIVLAIAVGSLVNHIFGGGGPSAEEKAMQALSDQIYKVGLALGNQINALGVHIDGEFVSLRTMISLMKEDLMISINAVDRDLSEKIHYLSEQLRNVQVNQQYLFKQTNKLIVVSVHNIVSTLNDFSKNVMEQFLEVNSDLNQLHSLIDLVNTKVDSLTNIVENGFKELYSQQYETMKSQVLEYYSTSNYGQVPALNPTAVRQAFLSVIKWLSVDAKKPIFHGDLDQQYTFTRMQANIVSRENDVPNNVNLLIGVLATNFAGFPSSLSLLKPSRNYTRPFIPSANSLCYIQSDNKRFINPIVWTEMAQDLIQFIIHTPEYSLSSNDRCSIQKVVTAGEDFLGMILYLKTNDVIFRQMFESSEINTRRLISEVYLKVVTTLKLESNDILQRFSEQITEQYNNGLQYLQSLQSLRSLLDGSCGYEYVNYGTNWKFGYEWHVPAGCGLHDHSPAWLKCEACNPFEPVPPGYPSRCNPRMQDNYGQITQEFSCNQIMERGGLVDSYVDTNVGWNEGIGSRGSVQMHLQDLPVTFCNSYQSLEKLNAAISTVSLATTNAKQVIDSILSNNATSSSNTIDYDGYSFNSSFFQSFQASLLDYETAFSPILLNSETFFGFFDNVNQCPLLKWNKFVLNYPSFSSNRIYGVLDWWYYIDFTGGFPGSCGNCNPWPYTDEYFIGPHCRCKGEMCYIIGDAYPNPKIGYEIAGDRSSDFSHGYGDIKESFRAFTLSNGGEDSASLRESFISLSESLRFQLMNADLLRTDYFIQNGEVVGEPEELLTALMNWANQKPSSSLTSNVASYYPTLNTKQKIHAAIMQDIQSGGVIKQTLDALNLDQDLLMNYLTLAFSDEFNLDVLALQRVRALLTADKVQAFLSLPQQDSQNFIAETLYQSIFPPSLTFAPYDNVTRIFNHSLLMQTKEYILSAIDSGKKHYHEGTLDAGYWKMSAVLDQVRDLRDFFYPQGVSALTITATKIAEAFSKNDEYFLNDLDRMLFDLNKIDPLTGNSALMILVASCDTAGVARLLQKPKINLNLLNFQQESVLNLAVTCPATCSKNQILTWLIQKGADTCQPTDYLKDQLTILSKTLPQAQNISCFSNLYSVDSYCPMKELSSDLFKPSTFPTFAPSLFHTIAPSRNSSSVPTCSPTSAAPSFLPSVTPSVIPTTNPTVLPTITPTKIPTAKPSITPTVTPSRMINPTMAPSINSKLPTTRPKVAPSVVPSLAPTTKVSSKPTVLPTKIPSKVPTKAPITSAVHPQDRQQLKGINDEIHSDHSVSDLSAGSPASSSLSFPEVDNGTAPVDATTTAAMRNLRDVSVEDSPELDSWTRLPEYLTTSSPWLILLLVVLCLLQFVYILIFLRK